MSNIKACIFDLDGVIVDTAKYHFEAWKRLANELGFDFTPKQNELLKGVSRVESFKIILGIGGIEMPEAEQVAYREKKNDWYKEFISGMDEREILPGITDFLQELQSKGIKLALGSASKNAQPVLKAIGLFDTFEVIVDGLSVSKAKPDPEVFLKAAKGIGIDPENCVVFEDAYAGVQAANAAKMFSVGVGKEEDLPHANIIISGFQDFDLESLQSHFG